MISRPWKFLSSLVTQKSTTRWLTVETNCSSLVQGFMSLPSLEMVSHNFASLSPFHMLKGKLVMS
ncbi:hypothetical protein NC652_036610 [Populus alba x Populus x berolinensis]|nr:hypothetical protein NC652_036610 [Populus alba x Populus x berolinensis]